MSVPFLFPQNTRKDFVDTLSRVCSIVMINEKIAKQIFERQFPEYIPYKTNLTWLQYLVLLSKTYDFVDITQSEMKQVRSSDEEIKKNFIFPWINFRSCWKGGLKINNLYFNQFADNEYALINLRIFEINKIPGLMGLILRDLNYTDQFLTSMSLAEYKWIPDNKGEYPTEMIFKLVKINKHINVVQEVIKDYDSKNIISLSIKREIDTSKDKERVKFYQKVLQT